MGSGDDHIATVAIRPEVTIKIVSLEPCLSDDRGGVAECVPSLCGAHAERRGFRQLMELA
jgi:hypothetical protein